MPPQSPSAGNGVFLRMRSGRNCVILTIVPGLGRPSMASTVTRFSQRSPVTRIIGYSFLLPVIGATATFTLSDCTASIGHRPSVRIIRATRTMCTSIQASSAGAATFGISAPLFVLSQNKNKVGSAVRYSEASKPWGCKASAPHPRQNLGEARNGRRSRQNCNDKTRDIQIGAV